MAAEVGKSVALLFAMEGEARPVIDALGLRPKILPETLSGFPFRYFTGLWKGVFVTVGCNGKDARHGVDQVGGEPAALNAFLALQNFRPRLVVSCGTAGSAKQLDSQVGEVFLSRDGFVFLDHRIPLAGLREFGVGDYPSADTREMAAALGLRQSRVASRGSLDFSQTDLDRFHALEAGVEDMEAASIAWVCHVARTPFFALKAITNEVSESAGAAEAFEENFPRAVASLRDQTVRVLDWLSQNPWPGLPA